MHFERIGKDGNKLLADIGNLRPYGTGREGNEEQTDETYSKEHESVKDQRSNGEITAT